MYPAVELAKKVVPRSVKRVLKRQIQKRFRPYVIHKDVEGVAFDLLIGDYEGRQWYDLNCTGSSWKEMRILRGRMLQAGDVVFECGAHHGCTAIMLSRWVGDEGHVLAFEPRPSNCDIIDRNIALNDLRNVTLERKAVGATRGEVFIDNASNTSVLSSGEGPAVGLVPLDDYADLKPTLLKIDVEGYEREVLRGARRILESRPKIALEVHTGVLHRYDTSAAEVLSLIPLERYRTWIQWDDNAELVPFEPGTPITKRVHLYCLPA